MAHRGSDAVRQHEETRLSLKKMKASTQAGAKPEKRLRCHYRLIRKSFSCLIKRPAVRFSDSQTYTGRTTRYDVVHTVNVSVNWLYGVVSGYCGMPESYERLIGVVVLCS